jgi:hypothetical protein
MKLKRTKLQRKTTIPQRLRRSKEDWDRKPRKLLPESEREHIKTISVGSYEEDYDNYGTYY